MKRILPNVFLLLLIFVSCQQPIKAPLTLPALFSNHMVLQQGQEAVFWGSSAPEQSVAVKGSWGNEIRTTADASGHWQLELPTPKAGGPFTVDIISGENSIEISDVMVGEVWLASGQSNMEMPLKGWRPNGLIENSEEEIAEADLNGIRMYTVPRAMSLTPLDSVGGSWKVSSPETAGDFSASAYFFAKRLHRELKVPVGIIHSSWGGTVAEAWVSEPSLRTLGDFNEEVDMIKDPATFEVVNKWFGRFNTLEIPETEEQWQQIDFNDMDASKFDFDDSQWESIEIPGRIDLVENGSFDGAVWIRKEVEITDTSTDYVLKLGAIDDMDATYFNGEKVGGLEGEGYWNVPREMIIPKNLIKKGGNIVAIRIIDTGGGGSVNGPAELTSGSGETISLAGSWKYVVLAEIYQDKFHVYGLGSNIRERPNFLQMNPNLPTVLFNAMINPLLPYNIKGAIWYQGESNVGRDQQYRRLFPALIADWREKWKSDFPFYYVQIAPYLYSSDPSEQVSQKLRDAQRLSLKTPKTGMVVTLDIGNPNNIHPANKQDVGARLAGLALANDYGKDLVASGPLFKGLTRAKNILILEFDHADGGLKAGDKGLTGFEIAGADGVYKEARATIKGNTIEVSAAGISSPQHARYAWRDDSEASLFNQAGLPASSFSSEN